MSTDCGPPVPLNPQFLSLSNPATDGSDALLLPIVAPSADLILQLITFGPTGFESSFFTGASTSGPFSPSSFGRDAAVNAQGPSSTPPGPPPTVPPVSRE
jgi:hypothetical protein